MGPPTPVCVSSVLVWPVALLALAMSAFPAPTHDKLAGFGLTTGVLDIIEDHQTAYEPNADICLNSDPNEKCKRSKVFPIFPDCRAPNVCDGTTTRVSRIYHDNQGHDHVYSLLKPTNEQLQSFMETCDYIEDTQYYRNFYKRSNETIKLEGEDVYIVTSSFVSVYKPVLRDSRRRRLFFEDFFEGTVQFFEDVGSAVVDNAKDFLIDPGACRGGICQAFNDVTDALINDQFGTDISWADAMTVWSAADCQAFVARSVVPIPILPSAAVMGTIACGSAALGIQNRVEG